MSPMVVRFWGVRGSYPTPRADVLRYGGNTACVEVRAGGRVLILDCGTGAIPLGKALVREGAGRAPVLLLTHLHHDHTQGFPFFAPAYDREAVLHIFGPGTAEEVIEALLPPSFPLPFEELPARVQVHPLTGDGEILVGPPEAPPRWVPIGTDPAFGGVRVRVLSSRTHPRHGIQVFRIEWAGRSLVYATDTEGASEGDPALIRFAQGADVLIHDAQYAPEAYLRRRGFGHSTPEMAAAVARAAGVGQLILFHHDPEHDDEAVARQEDLARRLFPNTLAAYEGLEIVLK